MTSPRTTPTGRPRKPLKPVLKPDSALSSYAPPNFIVSEGGLSLPAAQEKVYALIYHFSQNEVGCYFGSVRYTSARLGISRRAVIDSLAALAKRGLITEVGVHRQGDNRNSKKYMATDEGVARACASFRAYWEKKGKEYLQELKDYNKWAAEQGIVENSPSGANSAPEDFPDDVENNPSGANPAPGSGAGFAPESLYIKEEAKGNPTVQPKDSGTSPHPGPETGSTGRSGGSGEDRRGAFDRMAAASVNRNLLGRREDVERCRAAFSRLAASGLSEAALESAWRSRLERARAERSSPRHFPQLLRWLESDAPDGARAMAASLAERDRAESSRQRSVRMSLAAAADPELGELVERARSLQLDLERHGVGTRELVGSAWAAARERFDEIEQGDHRNRSANMLQI